MSDVLKDALYRAGLAQLREDRERAELKRACDAFADGLVALEDLVGRANRATKVLDLSRPAKKVLH